MAFVPLTITEVTTGEPTSTTTGSLIRTNFNDHESRLSSLEISQGLFRPLRFSVRGEYTRFTFPAQSLLFDRLTFDTTLISGKLFVINAGTSGTLEIDILFKRGVSAFTSIFSTRPKLIGPFSQFDTNTGVLSTTALLSGDFLRLDIISAATINTGFYVDLDFEV